MIQFTYFNNVLKNKLSFADSLEKLHTIFWYFRDYSRFTQCFSQGVALTQLFIAGIRNQWVYASQCDALPSMRYKNMVKFEGIFVFILTSFLKVFWKSVVCETVSGGGLLLSALEVLWASNCCRHIWPVKRSKWEPYSDMV